MHDAVFAQDSSFKCFDFRESYLVYLQMTQTPQTVPGLEHKLIFLTALGFSRARTGVLADLTYISSC